MVSARERKKNGASEGDQEMGAGCSGPRAGRVGFSDKVRLECRLAAGEGDENGYLGTCKGPEAGGTWGAQEQQGGQCGWGRDGKGSRSREPKSRGARPEDLRDHCGVLTFMISEMGGARGF